MATTIRQPEPDEPSPRRPISKRARFDVFERDGFTCQYCGRKPPDVFLEVDHVYPVSQGGASTRENLTTACSDCNRGKGAKILRDGPGMSEAGRARRAQEMLEREAVAKAEIKAIQADKERRQAVTDWVCDLLGVDGVARPSVSCVVNLIDEFGHELVSEWFDSALSRLHSCTEKRVIKYVCGCARFVRKKSGGGDA